MDRFRELSAFVAVVDSGSFVAAAETLHLSKAAVSRAVSDLEARLGARLIQRTTRRLSLTEAGRAYHGRCRQILAELAEADGAVGTVTGQTMGLLRVNAPVSFGILHLAPLWGEFLAQHPAIELDLTLSDRRVDLVEEGFDLAIRVTRPQDSTLVHRQLATTRIVLCASPAYLAEHGAPRSPAELARHAIVGYSYAQDGDVWRFAGPEGAVDVATRPRVRVNNGETCRAIALAGGGITRQPDFLVGEDLAQGRLVEVLPGLASPPVGIHAVFPSRQHLSVKVRSLVDFLAARFARPSWGTGISPRI
ncbi:MAG: LysR family transcriptional regulator [Rhodocyclaceae bacterium]|nr:LysR family transcriptional regulator [Rhodocyclaceae bacterium]